MKDQIIDLLIDLYNNEEMPKKIKHKENIYLFDEDIKWYIDHDSYYVLDSNYKHINDNVEILEEKEEKKIPEKLNKQHFHKKQRQLANKINEIIDYLKSKGE